MYADIGENRLQLSGGGGSGSGNSDPLATTKIYFGTTEPEGYKFANGQAISRTEYAELFSIIGTTYGAGDGSTTFNLPDMSGRVPVGLHVNKEWFNQLGKTGGSEEVTLTIEQMPEHSHNFDYKTYNSGSGTLISAIEGSYSSNLYGPTRTNGGDQPHTNLQPYITVNYIIKVKNIASENVIVPDYIPIGTELDYEGTKVPEGYEEIPDNKPKILWTNPNPENGMEADTIINLSSDDYDEIRWFFCYNNTSSNIILQKSTSCEKGNGVMLNIMGYSTGYNSRRILDYVNDTQYKARIGLNSGSADASANFVIPLKAIGIKY